MSEWHLSPDYIVNHWTDELLNLMIEKMSERYEKMNGKAKPPAKESEDTWVSDEALFAQLGGKLKVVKGG